MGSVLLHIAHEAGGVDVMLADGDQNGALWRRAERRRPGLAAAARADVPVTLVVNRAQGGGRLGLAL